MKTIKVKRKDYVSPSQINSFIDNRPQYIKNYVMGGGWNASAFFGRGNALEGALDKIIDGEDMNSCSDWAWDYYLNYCKENSLSEGEAAKVSEEEVRNMVMAAGTFYIHELGATPAVEKQVKINLDIPGIKPILGYLDYVFPGDGFLKKKRVRDLKGSSKTPSKLSDRYKLQGTVYHLATGCPVTFDHVVNLKSGAKVKSIDLTDEDISEYKPIIIAAAKAMDAFWEIVPDEINEDYIDAFNALSFPNLYGMWSADERKAAMDEFVTNQ